MNDFEINPELDAGAFRARFGERGRVRIPDLLEARSALSIYKHLSRDIAWNTFLVADDTMYGTTVPAPSGAEDEMRAEAREAAKKGFACLYDADRLFPEEIPQGAWSQNPGSSPLLAIFRERLNSPQFLDFARAVTGIAEITRADIQATRHRAGHFVNFHTTLPYSVQGGRRVAGFEINFTLEWRPEWGGLHTFKTLEDYTAEACIPSFNLLDLFGCHKGRWISTVSDAAAGERLAVAGWLYAPESETAHGNH